MARYMLDTNMCIYLMKNQPEQVARRFAQCYVGDVVMSAITCAELEYGVSISERRSERRSDLDALIELRISPILPVVSGTICYRRKLLVNISELKNEKV